MPIFPALPSLAQVPAFALIVQAATAMQAALAATFLALCPLVQAQSAAGGSCWPASRSARGWLRVIDEDTARPAGTTARQRLLHAWPLLGAVDAIPRPLQPV